jgi:PIN domain nuclease of toxin-antitoxin system
VRLLRDTAVLIFAVESPEKLTKKAAAILGDAENTRELSILSVSEIAIKSARGELGLSLADVERAIEDLDVRVVPYILEHAVRLFDLPFHHADPFDRQIIAQALCEGIPVVTSDEEFNLYKGLKIIW